MINIKMGDLYNGYGMLLKLSKRDLPFGVALSVADVVDETKNKVEEFERQKVNIINKYGEKADGDKYQIPPENVAAFKDAIDEISSVEFTLTANRIPVDKFGDMEITAEEVSALRWLIET
jgi:stress response protein YsnF